MAIMDSQGYYAYEAARSNYGCSSWNGGGGGDGSSGTTCNGNQCGENIISCCSWQGFDVCANSDGSCPQEGNHCGTTYCELGESCCSGNICSTNGICPDSGGGGGDYGGSGSGTSGCNNDYICQPENGETYDNCYADCHAYNNGGGDNGGSGDTGSGGTDPCPGGWMGPYGCEYPERTCDYPQGSYWTGAECACPSRQISPEGYCRDPNEKDCVSPRGSSWDDYQQRCICASQMVDNGMGECVPYDSGGGEHYIEPYYHRRLRATKTIKTIKTIQR